MTMTLVPASTAWPQRSVPLMRWRHLRSVSCAGELNDRLRAQRGAETEASQVLNRASSGPPTVRRTRPGMYSRARRWHEGAGEDTTGARLPGRAARSV